MEDRTKLSETLQTPSAQRTSRFLILIRLVDGSASRMRNTASTPELRNLFSCYTPCLFIVAFHFEARRGGATRSLPATLLNFDKEKKKERRVSKEVWKGVCPWFYFFYGRNGVEF